MSVNYFAFLCFLSFSLLSSRQVHGDEGSVCNDNAECKEFEACLYNQCLDISLYCKDPRYCGYNATCMIQDHEAVCLHRPNFAGNQTTQCEAKKVPECTAHADCADDRICTSDGQCEDPCLLMQCGENAVCSTQRHSMSCQCLPGYLRRDNTNVTLGCAQCTCHFDCRDSEICSSTGTCEDPCRSMKCGDNSVCVTSDHFNVRCQCLSGFHRADRTNTTSPCQQCGVGSPNIRSPSLISSGREVDSGEFPWHVALYLRQDTNEWEYYCAGTLISPDLIITAAQCVVFTSGRVEAADVRVGLGKIHRDMNYTEDHSIIASVKGMALPPVYLGSRSNYAFDIALLQLSQRVRVNDFIKPACMDWDQTIRLDKFENLHVAGWGDNAVNSQLMRAEQLKYFDLDSCLERIASKNVSISGVTYDKFCAEMPDGLSAMKGYGGGGVTVVRNRQHFVVGIVSTGIRDLEDMAMFTNIADLNHVSWLGRERARLGN